MPARTGMATLGDIARTGAHRHPAAIALRFEGRDTSFAALDEASNRVAHGLAALGLKPGDRIALLTRNIDRFFEVLIGAAKAGMVVVPIGWRLAPDEIGYLLRDSEARLLFTVPEFGDIVGALRIDAPHLDRLFGLEGEHPALADYVRWHDAHPSHDPALPVEPGSAVLQLYTSGTTGRPKGAVLSHANILTVRQATVAAGLPWSQWSAGDVSLLAMPVTHIAGIGWAFIALMNGARTLLLRDFAADAVLDHIARDGVSKIFLVPSALQALVALPRARTIDYGRLRYILYGASPIPLALLKQCVAVFGCGFVQMYGMTETAGTAAYLPPEDHDPGGNPRMAAAGLPLPGVEIRVVDETGAPLPPDVVGEVAIRSPGVMLGYWRREEESRAAIDADGWMRSGDAGYIDADGYLFLHDRIKDMIVSGGENVYPAEVENALHAHPAVAEVAVIGVPDPRWGEAVKAVVVPRPGATIDAGEVIAFARERLAGYKTPKSVDIIDALPRNAAGKLLRRALREPYWTGHQRRVN